MKTSGIHVSYQSKEAFVNSYKVVNLDVDDTTSYGPETTTITQQLPGKFTFYVQDFTNRMLNTSTALANSGAIVTVYIGNQQPTVFHVPNQSGTLWEVFSLENGVILPSNTMSYHSDPGTVGY